MTVDYTSWHENAKNELKNVQEEKAGLLRAVALCDRQINALTQTMNALAPLVGAELLPAPSGLETEAGPGGLTDTIRAILTEAGEPLTASEIREKLEARGFDMKSYSNPLANIHTILRRLTEAKAVETTHEIKGAAPGGKRFAISLGKGLEVEKVWGKSFEIGKLKGFVGKGRLQRRRRVD
jgi:DNA-binding PadR family transcriptional regulator